MSNVKYPVLIIRRKELKLSQETVAKKIGVTRVAYSLKEVGKHPFTIDEAKILSELFGMSIENLMFGSLESFLMEETK
ncbi:MAG: helix-turn-helix transcriptional regulator [Staphylococcus saprophyticus]